MVLRLQDRRVLKSASEGPFMAKTRRHEVLKENLPHFPAPCRLNRESVYSLAYHLVRLGLGALFVYAGFIKLLDPKALAHSLAQFDLLPLPLLPLVAVGLPALELLAGLGLVFEVRGCLTAITILLGAFLLVLGYAIFLGLDVDCGCFTVDELNARTSVKHAFFRDVGLVAAIIFLFRRRQLAHRQVKSTTIKVT
jgi:uncharacterized membrane protein YphA (DoxX/SURF4 family)